MSCVNACFCVVCAPLPWCYQNTALYAIGVYFALHRYCSTLRFCFRMMFLSRILPKFFFRRASPILVFAVLLSAQVGRCRAQMRLSPVSDTTLLRSFSHAPLTSVFSQNPFSFSSSQFAGLASELRPETSVYERCEMLLNSGYLDSALWVADAALTKALQQNDIPTSIYAEWMIGRSLGRKGNSGAMFDRFFRALGLAEQMSNPYWRGFMELSIGSMYVQSNVHDRAALFLNRAVTAGRLVGDSLLIANALSGIAEIEGRQNRYHTMIRLTRVAIAAIPKNYTVDSHAYFVFGHLHHKLGRAYQGVQNTDSAAFMMNVALNIFTKSGNKRFVPDVYLGLAEVYTMQHRYALAGEMLDSAERYIDRMRLTITRYALYKARAALADSTGDYKKAYHNFQRFHFARDSVFSSESAVKSEAMKNDFLQRLEAQQRRSTTVLLAAVIIAMCVIIAVLWNRYHLKKRAEKELFEQQEHIANQAFTIQNANLQLEQRNSELSELNSMKNTFLGIASHDLKNPLSQIMTSGGLIQQQAKMLVLGDHSSKQQTILTHSERILSAAEFMNRIIQDLLDVNKLESGTMIAQIREVPLDVLLRVVQTHEAAAAKKGIQIELAQTERELKTMRVQADERALVQVLDNLVSNAVKYSPLGKTVWVRVNATLDESETMSGDTISNGAYKQRWARVEVQDEGQGLSEEDKIKVFEKFARLSATPTAGESSTGLGLAISKELMKQMHGEIGFQSSLGQGATFFIRLPLASSDN